MEIIGFMLYGTKSLHDGLPRLLRAILFSKGIIFKNGFKGRDSINDYLDHIKYYCLVMSECYIKNNFASIKKYASAIENRLDDEWCTMESVLKENAHYLELAQKYDVNYVLIDNKYEINIDIFIEKRVCESNKVYIVVWINAG